MLKVLLIEDDSATVEAIRLCFEIHRPDAMIVAAASGFEGIKLSASEAPDVVIIDLGLDDIDGIEVLREIRHFSDVPIVIVSARDEPESVAKVMELGADDYIVKPFDIRGLLTRLDNATHRHHVS